MAETITRAAEECNAMASHMDFHFLFLPSGEEEGGKKRKKEKKKRKKKERKRKKKEEKRTLQLACRDLPKKGSPPRVDAAPADPKGSAD